MPKRIVKINQIEFRVEKVVNRKDDKLCIKWKRYDNTFGSWIDRKDTVKMSKYFPKPKLLGGNVKDELYFSNYATK